MSTRDSRDVLSLVDREKGRYLEELLEYLRIPSISTDSAYRQEVQRAADWLVARFQKMGLAAEKIATSGHPLVYAEWSGAAASAPTILFYGHYDVQPPDPLEEWLSPPFQPLIQNGSIVARGATDDKGQSYAHLAAVDALLKARGRLPVNVKFLIEGEEESGGEAIEAYVRADQGQRLRCDAVVVSDTAMWARGCPALTYGLRGLAYFELRVFGPNRDLHSGVYGGGVRNPALALSHVLDSLVDAGSGKILIPGFYDDVRSLEEWERQELAGLGLNEVEVAQDLQVSALPGEEGYSYLERTWARPSCDVNGLTSGYQGPGAKTVLPARASAKLSFRLVADQRPDRVAELLRAHIARVLPSGTRFELDYLHGAFPVTVDVSGPIVEAGLQAMADVWGRRAVRIRSGGSIPIVGTFAEVLKVPVLLMGFGLEEDRLHSPNEKFDLENFEAGMRTVVRFLDRLGEGTSA